MPQAIFHEPVDELLLADSALDAGPIGNATAILAVTPRRDLLLFLDVDPRTDSVRGVARIQQDRQESGESRQRPGHRIAETRELVTTLSNSLNALELDLSFSIEAYADSILIPELLVESFHASLRQVSALADGP